MNRAIHYYHTHLLALDLGFTPTQARQLARFNQMTDWATPENLTEEYWPQDTAVFPRVTQLSVTDAARLLAGERWFPGFEVVHKYHFGGGAGGYGTARFDLTLERFERQLHVDFANERTSALTGQFLHLLQDFASHKGYTGFPSEDNRKPGDSQGWARKLWAKMWHSNNIMGHVLRPEVDKVEVSREAIYGVTRHILFACHAKDYTVAPSLQLLFEDTTDAKLTEACKLLWMEKTGTFIPDFHAPSPQSREWEEWCRT
jgi:hypothetical protein